ncbi:L-proline trans-4-hydroxylase-like [Saccostrea cucullata]|uniref:L-proline trans-4-hydroxylase-like n=1 Tax=Saccostrea cuccullata TaxID=36930 RepID=UPI002ED1B133
MERHSEYEYRDNFKLSDQAKRDFEEYGYILIKGLLDKEEVNKVLKVLESSDAMMKENYEFEEVNKEKKTQRIIWSHPGTDVTGMVARSEKVAGTCEQLLGGEVYHYHGKMILKGAQKGARHLWHQDYGYWYNNGCLFPDMMTVFIPLDPCRKENGCLQILEGSHKCGRIDHHPVLKQAEADLTRVEEIKKTCPHKFVEMDPGDALFFHCNVLHHSSDNNSDMRRWVYICTYNKASNDPIIEHHHPRYTPLNKVPNSAIKECTNFTDMSGKDFIHPDRNTSLTEHIRVVH